jgi:hypothetical protein
MCGKHITMVNACFIFEEICEECYCYKIPPHIRDAQIERYAKAFSKKRKEKNGIQKKVSR